MPYQWPLDPQDLFGERYPQMVNTGLPAADADAVRGAITDMWADAPGGWVHEWSALGRRHAEAGRHALAALAYGWARFPCLADDAKRTAHERQLESFLASAPAFPVDFERRVLTLPYRGATTSVPVHVLSRPGLPADAPVLIASGGIDSWKMDLHGLFQSFALALDVHVVAFDIPGTGESTVPLDPHAHEVVAGLIAAARELGNGAVGHFGVSMGGYLSARSGLAGTVDAAIVLGGPVEESFSPDRGWRHGMDGIIGNAMGFDHRPAADELGPASAALSLRHLLNQDRNAPMLVVNGADDVHVPQHDTLVFAERRDTRVSLVPGTGHCAASKIADVLPDLIAWLGAMLAGATRPPEAASA